jgi:cytochrome c oxidase assembly factor CtaG
MTTLLTILVLLAAHGNAAAHGGPVDALGTVATWTYDLWIVIPLYASALLYLVGTRRLWRHAGHGHGVRHWQAACFWCGWTSLALALLSPLHWLGERLFVAHMIEHEVLMVIAAPLLAIARPVGAFLWALPPRWRVSFGRAARHPAIDQPWRAIRNPLTATVMHGVALWIWHMPLFYNAVLSDLAMHRLQHASFFFSALLFWWSLFYGPLRARGYGIAVGCLFFTSLHSAVLGIFLTLARQPWYPQQGEFAVACGLTPLEDQQLAGLVMWVPPGLIYLGVALYLAAQWISHSGTGQRTRSVPCDRVALSAS